MFVKTLNYNPLIGIRIMTTRNSKTNWRRTHNLMSILSIPFALFLIVLGQFISYKAAILLTFILWLGIPILYSIYIYRNEGI
ncbi:SdpI family protein [Ignavigranum ruoffiae]|uniref:SdpI family protein n=1 Tax=Ignavigranum ruoffiae TaxID=89093 RepID=UPI003D153B4C